MNNAAVNKRKILIHSAPEKQRKSSIKTHALTGESGSHREDQIKPSILSNSSSKNHTIATPDYSQQKRMIENKKSLFKIAAENQARKTHNINKQSPKPLSIVLDSKEYTNSLDSSSKPSSPVSRLSHNNHSQLALDMTPVNGTMANNTGTLTHVDHCDDDIASLPHT